MYKKYVKNVIDIVGAILLVPILIFPITIIALLVLLFDGRPVLYCGKRLGKNGKEFKMFKFRTMKVNSPDWRNSDGSTFNSVEDERLTRIGKVIRRFSLDELPQIFNVLNGSMSFVGPRPGIISNNKSLSDLSDLSRRRLEVKPGITGYSQSMYRNSINQTQKFNNDLFYIENISFIMDIKITLKTISAFFSPQKVFSSKGKRPHE